MKKRTAIVTSMENTPAGTIRPPMVSITLRPTVHPPRRAKPVIRAPATAFDRIPLPTAGPKAAPVEEPPILYPTNIATRIPTPRSATDTVPGTIRPRVKFSPRGSISRHPSTRHMGWDRRSPVSPASPFRATGTSPASSCAERPSGRSQSTFTRRRYWSSPRSSRAINWMSRSSTVAENRSSRGIDSPLARTSTVS